MEIGSPEAYNRPVPLHTAEIPIPARFDKTAASLFVLSFLALHAFFLWSVRDQIARGDPDFTAFYTAGRMVWEGHGSQIYDRSAQWHTQQEFASHADRQGPLPYVHPPFETLLFVPLAWMSYKYAFVLWSLTHIGILFGVAILLRRLLPVLRRVRVWILVALCVAFFPVFANFHQGQDALLLLLVVTLAFRALQKGADLQAGIWFGLGLFRYHLIIPLVLILLLWRRWKVFPGFLASATAAFVLSAVVAGWHATLAYPAYVWSWITTPGIGRTPVFLMPSLLGVIAGWPVPDTLTLALHIIVAAASVALLIIAATLRRRFNDPGSWSLGFAVAIVCTCLVAYNTSTYDLCLLVLPIAIVANHCSQKGTGKTALLLPLLPLLISPLWFFLWLRWEKINLLAIFLIWWLFAIRHELSQTPAAKSQPSAALST